MDVERERGLEAGRRWAENASSHELATLVDGIFDDICRILPEDASDQFVGGFREALLHASRGIVGEQAQTDVAPLFRCARDASSAVAASEA